MYPYLFSESPFKKLMINTKSHEYISEKFLDGISYVNSPDRVDRFDIENAYPEQRQQIINRVNVMYDRVLNKHDDVNTAHLYFTHRAVCDQLARKLRGDDEKGENTKYCGIVSFTNFDSKIHYDL